MRLLVGRDCTAGAWHRQAKDWQTSQPRPRTCAGDIERRAHDAHLSAAQLPAGWVTGAKLVHCEGYVLYRPAFARDVLRAARRARALVRQTCLSSSIRECANVFAHKPGVLRGQCAVHPAIVLVVLCTARRAGTLCSDQDPPHCVCAGVNSSRALCGKHLCAPEFTSSANEITAASYFFLFC